VVKRGNAGFEDCKVSTIMLKATHSYQPKSPLYISPVKPLLFANGVAKIRESPSDIGFPGLSTCSQSNHQARRVFSNIHCIIRLLSQFCVDKPHRIKAFVFIVFCNSGITRPAKRREGGPEMLDWDELGIGLVV